MRFITIVGFINKNIQKTFKLFSCFSHLIIFYGAFFLLIVLLKNTNNVVRLFFTEQNFFFSHTARCRFLLVLSSIFELAI